MSTLFARLTSPPLAFKFTATVSSGDPILTGLSDTSGLLAGMPLSGRGLAQGTTLASVDPVTLSKPPNISGGGVELTQGIANPLRILVPVGEITALPAMCLIEGAETWPSASAGSPRTASNQPQIVTLSPYAWIYAQAKDPAAVPNSIINALLDAIDAAIRPSDGTSWQNLGLKGVHHCRIEGQTLRSPGVDGLVSARVQFVIQVMAGIDTVPLP